jgi:hypothetical protein
MRSCSRRARAKSVVSFVNGHVGSQRFIGTLFPDRSREIINPSACDLQLGWAMTPTARLLLRMSVQSPAVNGHTKQWFCGVHRV